MPLRDRRGIAHSTNSPQAMEHYDRAVELLAGFYNDPFAELDAALAADPEFAGAHILRGAIIMTMTERRMEGELRACVEAAEALAATANDRERIQIAAIRAALDGDLAGAFRRFGEAAIAHPRDALSVQIAHMGGFYLGQPRVLRDTVAAALPQWSESDPGYGFLLGMYAFGLEELNEYSQAEETGRRALALNLRDPWATHAVAHVMEMQGRAEDGIAFMEGTAGDWAPENFLAYHNWWHDGLFHLDLGNHARVLEIYDAGIRPTASDVALELVDAAAMLWRLRLAGIDTGARWDALADTYEAFAEDGYYAFNDLHAAMTFLATGRDASLKKVVAAAERAAGGAGTNAMMTREVGLPLINAFIAFERGDYAAAVETIARVRHTAARFGGSNAQRDILDWTLVEAAIRGGMTAHARAFTAERLARKPESPMVRSQAARAKALAGRVAAAAE